MRSRNLKPGFFKNEQLAELPVEARLLFAGLWCMADREGRLEDRPKRIKIELFPGDSFDVDVLLTDLHAHGLIERYQVAQVRYIQVLNFEKHQHPHQKEPPSTLPKSGASTGLSTHIPQSTPGQEPDKSDASTGSARLIPDSGSLIPDSSPPESAADAADAKVPRGTSKKGTRLPEDAELTTAWRAIAFEHKLHPERTFEKFKNYWIAKPGANACKLDWTRTWRNWCIEESERQGRRQRDPPMVPSSGPRPNAGQLVRVKPDIEPGQPRFPLKGNNP